MELGRERGGLEGRNAARATQQKRSDLRGSLCANAADCVVRDSALAAAGGDDFASGAELASTQTKIGDRTRGQPPRALAGRTAYFLDFFLPFRRFSRFFASAFNRTGQRRQRGLDTQHFFLGLSFLAVLDMEERLRTAVRAT
jgi:hypothetical protein